MEWATPILHATDQPGPKPKLMQRKNTCTQRISAQKSQNNNLDLEILDDETNLNKTMNQEDVYSQNFQTLLSQKQFAAGSKNSKSTRTLIISQN